MPQHCFGHFSTELFLFLLRLSGPHYPATAARYYRRWNARHLTCFFGRSVAVLYDYIFFNTSAFNINQLIISRPFTSHVTQTFTRRTLHSNLSVSLKCLVLGSLRTLPGRELCCLGWYSRQATVVLTVMAINRWGPAILKRKRYGILLVTGFVRNRLSITIQPTQNLAPFLSFFYCLQFTSAALVIIAHANQCFLFFISNWSCWSKFPGRDADGGNTDPSEDSRIAWSLPSHNPKSIDSYPEVKRTVWCSK